MPDESFHQPHELGNKENKSEDNKTKECMTKNFANDVTIQDAHGANGEFNTLALFERERRER